MSLMRFFPSALVSAGVIALAAGGGMIYLKWHNTFGYAGLVLGIILSVVGVAAALTGRASGGAAGRGDSGLLGTAKDRRGKRLKTIVVAAIIVGATLGTFLFGAYELSSQSGGQFGLSLTVDSASEVTNPDGSVSVTVRVNAVGGIPPYIFAATWGDHINQTSTTGIFTRDFGAATPVSTAVTITASSANSGLGYLALSLPSQNPVAIGTANTKTLNIIPAAGPGAAQGGNAATSTQTRGTSSFIAVINASLPTVSATTKSVSTGLGSASLSTGTKTSTSAGLEVIVTVKGATSGQAVAGVILSVDGNMPLTTQKTGTAFFFGISSGAHSLLVTYGSWTTTIPFSAEGNSPVRLNVNAPGQ